MTVIAKVQPSNTLEDNLKVWLSHVKYEHLVAGVSGGVFATLLLHPLDVIKIRFAANDGQHTSIPQYQGIRNAFLTIYHNEGVRGLYRGVTPNAWGAGAAWGLYFLFYNAIKTTVQGADLDVHLNAGQHLLSASEAGLMTFFITHPLWVVKTRLCLQSEPNPEKQRYKGMWDALIKIYKADGIKGYYKGMVPGLFGISHGAIQFMVYEELKNRFNGYYGLPISTKLGTFHYLTFAALSKIAAVGFTYPYQVIRTRLQNQYYTYSGSIDCISKTWRYESWRGFYKGLGTNLLRVTPATMITFVTYENVSRFLMKL